MFCLVSHSGAKLNSACPTLTDLKSIKFNPPKIWLLNKPFYLYSIILSYPALQKCYKFGILYGNLLRLARSPRETAEQCLEPIALSALICLTSGAGLWSAKFEVRAGFDSYVPVTKTKRKSTTNVVLSFWWPVRESNPCFQRERLMS